MIKLLLIRLIHCNESEMTVFTLGILYVLIFKIANKFSTNSGELLGFAETDVRTQRVKQCITATNDTKRNT
jgi:hypothetical protein